MHRIFNGRVFGSRKSNGITGADESEKRRQSALLGAVRSSESREEDRNRWRKAAIWIFAGAAFLSAAYPIIQEINEAPKGHATTVRKAPSTTTTINGSIRQSPETTTTQPSYSTTTVPNIPTTTKKKPVSTTSTTTIPPTTTVPTTTTSTVPTTTTSTTTTTTTSTTTTTVPTVVNPRPVTTTTEVQPPILPPPSIN